MDHKVYNSTAMSGSLCISSGNRYDIDATSVYFEEEKITVTVDSYGHIEFFEGDDQSKSLDAVHVPASGTQEDPIDRYGKVELKKDGNTILLELPRYRWEDNYPHCDGEYDRWDRYTKGSFQVIFDLETKKITVEGR